LVWGNPLPLPMGEVARLWRDGEGLHAPANFSMLSCFALPLPSQSKIKDFCQLSHRESQVGRGPSGTPVPTMMDGGASVRTVGDAGLYNAFSAVRWNS